MQLFVFFLFVCIYGKRVIIPINRHLLDKPKSYDISNTFLLESGLSIDVKLTNLLDRIYLGMISIGEPYGKQNFSVVFDTGSADVWVLSRYHHCTFINECTQEKWDENNCDNVCCYFNDRMSSYDHYLSNTYSYYSSNKWDIKYGKGSAEGYLSKDNILIGDGLIAKGQIFAEATKWSMELISCSEPINGILGFAMKSASEDGGNTFIETLYNNGNINSKIFSVKLFNDNSKDSELIIGEPNNEYYNDKIIWGSVIQPTNTGMWFTQLNGLLLSNQTDYMFSKDTSIFIDKCGNDSPCLALIDTGTSYVTFPSSIYQIFIQKILDINHETVNCRLYANNQLLCDKKTDLKKLPNIFLQFNGYAFSLTPEQYMLTNMDCQADSYCLGISPLDNMGPHAYILGDTFLRQYYIVFDESNYRVGFGSLKTLVKAVPNEDNNIIWQYIKITTFIMAFVIICLCILVTICKWKRKSFNNNNSNHLNIQSSINMIRNNNSNNNNNDNNDKTERLMPIELNESQPKLDEPLELKTESIDIITNNDDNNE